MPASAASLDDPLGDLDPAVQHLLCLGEGRLRVGNRAVVGEHHAFRTQLRETPQAVHRLLEVEVGRRGGRPEHAEVGQQHADGVADQQRPGLLVEDRVVVLGVPGESTSTSSRPLPTSTRNPSPRR